MKAAGAFSGLPRELRDNIPGPRLAIFKADKPSAGRQRERPAIRGDGRRPLLPERQRPAPIRYVHNGQLVGCYEGARSEACRESYATTCRRYSVEIRQKEACLGNAVSGLCIHTAMATQRSPVFCAVAGAATFTIAAALH